jgi:CHASE2 domain-containing sensor protein
MTRFPRDPGSLATLALNLKPLHARLVLLGLAAVLTLLFLLVFSSSLRTFEDQVGALGWRLNPGTQLEERINVVAIDEKSLAQLGPWPWPRETVARLSSALTEAGVDLQLYDIVFDAQKAGDAELLDALQATNAVLSQVPGMQSDQTERLGVITHPLSGIACTASSNVAQGYIANEARFAPVAKGHITPVTAADGALRHVPAYICIDGQPYPALALSALLVATGTQTWAATVQPGAFFTGPAQVLQFDGYPGVAVPLDASGNMRVSFRNAPETYRAFPAVDIINGTIDTALLEGSWVLVGYTAFGLADIVPTPFSGAAPGVELQARILASVLDNTVPFTPRAAPLYLALLSALFAGILLFCASARERFAGSGLAACAVVLPLCAVLLHAELLSVTSIWLGWLAPSVYGIAAAGLLILHEYARVRLERGRVLGNLSSYLPTDVAHEIAYSLPNSSIHARRQDATLLCADLRNFSAYGEARPPEEAAALLHYFFVRTTAIIEKHHGRVHEFKGDGLLAIWDGSGAQPAKQAFDAAYDMQQAMQDVLPQTPPAGLEPLALGIGIEQGPVLIGSIGPAHRRTHTVLGETVTISLRIQDMTAELAQPILIGECAARQLSDSRLESQGSYLLAGLRIPHTLFAPPLLAAANKGKNANPSLKLLHGGRQ